MEQIPRDKEASVLYLEGLLEETKPFKSGRRMSVVQIR